MLVVQAADFLSGMGLGMVADQLKELKLGELLDTPPPGLDEAVAIAKVVQFVNSQVRIHYQYQYCRGLRPCPTLACEPLECTMHPKLTEQRSMQRWRNL